jgi:hypothetical protein
VLFIRLVIIYSRFPTHFPSKHLGLVLRPKRDLKETGLELVTSGLIWVSLVRPERDPNETNKRPKGDLFATSDSSSSTLGCAVAEIYLHAQNTLSHTHLLLTFSLTLQDLEYIDGVGTHSHSFHFPSFDPEPFHLPITF